jgi:sugar/nucleoside kinase (ribokinase family)
MRIMDDVKIDVVGVGALNVDYIATAAAVAQGSQTLFPDGATTSLAADLRNRGIWGVETSVDEQSLLATLDQINAAYLETALGGSAYNAVFALARTELGLRLGYVGVAGASPVRGLSSRQQMEALGIDTRLVKSRPDRLAGMCLSYVEEADRTLLTYSGANDGVAEYLMEGFDSVVQYLTNARVVHITSFLDDATPRALLRVLKEVRSRSAQTIFCVDPGHGWAGNRTPAVDAILSLSNFLIVNHGELLLLGGDAKDDQTRASRILARIADPGSVVIVKRRWGVQSYRMENGDLVCEAYSQQPLAASEIEDSTGAGDVFAAGLLAVVAGDRLKVELGSRLGMSLARHKLRFVGSAGHDAFPAITQRFIRARGLPLTQTRAMGVFIGHGHSQDWRSLKDFMESDCGVPTYSFESEAWEGTAVTGALEQYLAQCSAAVCVLTAEDRSGPGRRGPRRNVVHEIGLFLGRHGPSHVLMVVEEGCDFNLPDGLPRVDFARGRIADSFWRIEEWLRASVAMRSGALHGLDATT